MAVMNKRCVRVEPCTTCKSKNQLDCREAQYLHDPDTSKINYKNARWNEEPLLTVLVKFVLCSSIGLGCAELRDVDRILVVLVWHVLVTSFELSRNDAATITQQSFFRPTTPKSLGMALTSDHATFIGFGVDAILYGNPAVSIAKFYSFRLQESILYWFSQLSPSLSLGLALSRTKTSWFLWPAFCFRCALSASPSISTTSTTDW